MSYVEAVLWEGDRGITQSCLFIYVYQAKAIGTNYNLNQPKRIGSI